MKKANVRHLEVDVKRKLARAGISVGFWNSRLVRVRIPAGSPLRQSRYSGGRKLRFHTVIISIIIIMMRSCTLSGTLCSVFGRLGGRAATYKPASEVSGRGEKTFPPHSVLQLVKRGSTAKSRRTLGTLGASGLYECPQEEVCAYSEERTMKFKQLNKFLFCLREGTFFLGGGGDRAGEFWYFFPKKCWSSLAF